MTIGEKIKRLRKEKGMTQEELGARIGVQKAAINKYETGIVVNLKREVISKLASALDVNPIWLMDEEDGWPPVLSARTLIARAFYEDNRRKIVIPDSEKFRKIMEYMSASDYKTVMEIYERTYDKMREMGVEE